MTRRRGFTVLLVLAASAPLLAAPRIERAPEFVKRVSGAIERGVRWLKGRQDAAGLFPEFPGFEGGTTALAYHTLRVCGAAKDDPSAKLAWDALRRGYDKKSLRTYSAALRLMAIWSHGEPIPGAKDDRDMKLAPEDARWAEEIARAVVSAQTADGAWSYAVGGEYGPTGPPDVYDHSNMQYALLGLKCAARCGVAVDPVVWRRALLHFLAAQETAGPPVVRRGGGSGAKGATSAPRTDRARGWAYMSPEDQEGRRRAPYASMTAGGVSSVVICRSELLGKPAMNAKLEADSERSAWDGLAWLGVNWRPSAEGIDCYAAYGVERAGVLAGVEWMAELDWYGAAAEALLAAQAPDGSFRGARAGLVARVPVADASRDVADVCFALLFLKRGTTPVRRGAVAAEMDEADLGVDIDFAAAAGLTGRAFEDFIDLVLSRRRRATDDGVKERILDGAVSVGPRIVEPLLVRLDAADVEARAAAHALLTRATGLDFGYAADATDERRAAAVVKWQTWWMGAKARIGYDVETKRLVVF